MKGAENTAAPNMIVDEFFPKHIRQREDFAEIREAVQIQDYGAVSHAKV